MVGISSGLSQTVFFSHGVNSTIPADNEVLDTSDVVSLGENLPYVVSLHVWCVFYRTLCGVRETCAVRAVG